MFILFENYYSNQNYMILDSDLTDVSHSCIPKFSSELIAVFIVFQNNFLLHFLNSTI